MKRAGLRSSNRSWRFLAVLLLALPLLDPAPAQSATIGSVPCIQTIDITAGVSVYQDGNSCFIAFKTVGTYSWTPPTGVSKIDLLVVAGGGGGGTRHAGGGGAGGLINATNTTINASVLSVSVGGGGAGGAATSSGGNEGANGGNSQVSGGGITTQTAIGGGGGAYGSISGAGGSGGGGGCCGVGQGTATPGQGNLGSPGATSNPSYWVGGGGGGAGASGGASSSTTAGSGGAGLAITWITSMAQSNLIIGQNVSSQSVFAGGGGGGTDRASIPGGLGGNGGGGSGTNNATAGANGITNTGDGGGGGGINGGGAPKGGDGGSGVVVFRYSIPTFTNLATFSIAENTSTSTNAATILVSESSTITFRSTLDYSFFTIVVSDSVTARIRFINSPDYEAFADLGANNEYDLTIRATNLSGNYQEFALKITVTDVLESAAITSPTLSGAALKGRIVTLTVISNTPGKIQFLIAGKRIPNCLAQPTSGSYPNYSATCTWEPSISGNQRLQALLTPSNIAISSSISTPVMIFISKRTNTR